MFFQNIEGFDYILTDYCSGTIPLYERPKGSQIKSLIDQNKLTHLEIHDFSRLGRSTLDCLTVYKELTQLGIKIVCRNPNIVNIGDDGKPEIFSELLLSLLSVLNSYEKSLIRERQMEGIRIRKEKGLYSGRRIPVERLAYRFAGGLTFLAFGLVVAAFWVPFFPGNKISLLPP